MGNSSSTKEGGEKHGRKKSLSKKKEDAPDKTSPAVVFRDGAAALSKEESTKIIDDKGAVAPAVVSTSSTGQVVSPQEVVPAMNGEAGTTGGSENSSGLYLEGSVASSSSSLATATPPNGERSGSSRHTPTGSGVIGGASVGAHKAVGSRSRVKRGLVTAKALRDVGEMYDIDMDARLGHGHYGVVRRCTHKQTGELRAIKMIKKSKVSRVETLRREIEILKCVDHPNIIKLYDVFEDDRYIHLITELCTGGELFDRIIKKTESEEGHYSEADASTIVKMILSGIEYCHNVHNISHRDLKPENFIFKSKGGDEVIKIIDFGLSRFETETNPMTTRVGTPYYIAPEVLTRRYDKACDLWSIGVVTYILLAGYPPFDGDTDAEIFTAVKNGAYEFPSPEWDVISNDAKDFIRGLLHKNPQDRFTATQALAHPWFLTAQQRARTPPPESNGPGDLVHTPQGEFENQALLTASINRRLRRFVGMTELKKVALNVIAHDLQEAEIGHLGEMFTQLDEDGNGEISVEELEKLLAGTETTAIGEDVVSILQGVDIDGSNTLDYREFLAATMERRLFEREENIRKAFAYFDLDGTGVITHSSLVQIFGSETHAKKIMGDVDENSDGVIEFDEFKKMMLGG